MKYYAKRFWNKIITQGSGEARRCAVSITYKYSMQRSAVNQRHILCRGYPVSRSRERIIFCIVAIIKNRIIMKLIYRTLLLNKVCAQGSGAARRSAVSLTKRKSLQRYEVYQTTLFFWRLFNVIDFFVSNRKPWKAAVFGKNRAILCIYVLYFSRIGCFVLQKSTSDEY